MPEAPSPERLEFHTPIVARAFTLVLSSSWIAGATYLLWDAVREREHFLGWLYCLGLAVLAVAIGEALRKTRVSLRLDASGVRIRRWLWTRSVRWESIAAMFRRERLAVGPYGLPDEETEVFLATLDGTRLLAIPGSVGTPAASRMEEVLLARGFTKEEGEGGEAAWLLVAPGAPASARMIEPLGRGSPLLAGISRCLTAMAWATVPFGILAGWDVGDPPQGLYMYNPAFLCIGVSVLIPLVLFAIALDRALRPEGALRTQLLLCLCVAVAALVGYYANISVSGHGLVGGVLATQTSLSLLVTIALLTALVVSVRRQRARAERALDRGNAVIAAAEAEHERTGAWPRGLAALGLPVQRRDGDADGPIEYLQQTEGFLVRYLMGRGRENVYDSKVGRWQVRRVD